MKCTNYEAPHYAVFPFLVLHILIITLFSDTLSLCSSRNVGDQISHPWKTTSKFMVLYI